MPKSEPASGGFSFPAGESINSRQNPFIQTLSELARDSAARKRLGLALAEGPHLVAEALACKLNHLGLVFSSSSMAKTEISQILAQAKSCGIPTVTVADACYERFSCLKSPEGVAAVFSPKSIEPASLFIPGLKGVVLAGVQDPGNAGAIARAAAAAGANALISCEGSADPLHPAFLRAAMGAAFRIPVAEMPRNELAALAKKTVTKMLAAELRQSQDYRQADYAPPCLIVIGNEGGGIPADLLEACSSRISIPMANGMESLNAAVAAGIMLFQANWQSQANTSHSSK